MKKKNLEQFLHEEKSVKEVSKQIMAAYNDGIMDQAWEEKEGKIVQDE